MNLDWKAISLKKGLERHIPAEPGVYVIKSVRRVMNLPVTQELIYIGKSKNLRRRFKEHCDDSSEHNSGLLSERWKRDLEFWYARAGSSKIAELEKQLIGELDPLTNIVRYKEKKSGR